MLMRDRVTGEASHTMWVIKPVDVLSVPTEADVEALGLPEGAPLSGALGLGFYRRSPSQPILPFPHGRAISIVNFLCRICERQVPAWYFEKHNETCHEVHRLEAEISDQNENVSDLLRQAQELLSAIDESSPSSLPPSYKGAPIFTLPSLAIPPEALFSPSKPQLQAIRQMQHAVVRQVVDVLETCLEISTPSIKEDVPDPSIEHQRLLSPRSEDHMTLVNTWSKPSTEDPALSSLISDTATAIRNKVNAVNRMRNTIVYSERVRHEWEDRVEKTLAALSEEDGESVSESGSSNASGAERKLAESPAPIEDVSRDTTVLPVPTSDNGRFLPKTVSTAFPTTLDRGRGNSPHTPPTVTHTPPMPSLPGLGTSSSSSGASSLAPMQQSIISTRPRRVSHHRYDDPHDRGDVSSVTSSPVAGGPGSSPSRSRKPSVSGRPALGLDGPLSPRLPSTAPASRAATVSIKDFDIIKPISKGAFGSVYLAKKRATGDNYAIKVLKKADMISKNQITNVKAERKILSESRMTAFLLTTSDLPSLSLQ